MPRNRKTQSKRTYIEAYAADGEFYSQSLFLDTFQKWDGILVEPDPFYFDELKNKKRNATLINACLSTSNTTESISKYSRKKGRHWKPIAVVCHPLPKIFQFMNMNHVDVLFLDTHGTELLVLETIPFSEVTIKIIVVELFRNEVRHFDENHPIIKYLKQYDYSLFSGLTLPNRPKDGVFILNKEISVAKLKELTACRFFDIIFGEASKGKQCDSSLFSVYKKSFQILSEDYSDLPSELTNKFT
ncbi:uncharacterized protein LOC136025823 isoform X2 [Artemia franciscana]|uniref:Methyltransferase FkbM domain-containing protein n=1 Tax=Artemia franciscana TaxID=6661 RepID=A0AA88HJ07_ARTSF|nr:hypothetical protein QYM36_012405 [Artemia franciscana]